MRYFMFVTVVSAVVVVMLCSTHISRRPVDSEPKQEIAKEEEVQIRLYYDSKTTYFKGEKGAGLFMYGTRLLSNGGEEVVWRVKVSPTILWGDWGQEYADAILLPDRVIFPDKYGKFYEYDRRTGKLTCEGTKDDEHFKALFDVWQYHMKKLYEVDRPGENSRLDDGQRWGKGSRQGVPR